MRRWYRFRCILPSVRAGFGPFLWEFIGYWYEIDTGVKVRLSFVPKASDICQRRLGVG